MKITKTFLSLFIALTFFSNSNAQQESSMFYATIQTVDANELQEQHPEMIKVITSANGFSAVKLTNDAAEFLHEKVLAHGPGFIYESSEKSAIASLDKMKVNQLQRVAASFEITQQTLVNQSLGLVNNINIANQIQELESYGTRYHTTNSARQAVLDLKTKWENLAGNRSDVSVRIVNHNSTAMPSVVMTITGTEEPDSFVIVGGHIDSTARGNNNNAPGADDNASGIATITEAARVLFAMNYRPKRTVEFMAFAAEEVGLRGSKEIAEDYKRRNVDVVSYLQLDMTNYRGSSRDVYVSTDSYNSSSLNNFLIELMDYYNTSGAHQFTYGTTICNYGCSDHYSWAQQGYEVAFPFEATFSQSNPYIHTTNDTFDRSPTANATHAAKFAKLALEYLIEISNDVSSGGSNNCTNAITSFPYAQSFENSLGDWTQSTSDNLNWTIDANGTPSTGTGPSSAAQGSYYLYVEASGNGTGFPNKRAILNSPCFDLSTTSGASLSFSYHMVGNAVGSLNIEASSNNGASWTSIFSRTGSQGNAWNVANVNLSAYAGGSLNLRLNAVTGSSWQGDIAIDNIQISSSSNAVSSLRCDEVQSFSSKAAYTIGDQMSLEGKIYTKQASGWIVQGTCTTVATAGNKNADKVFTLSPNPVGSDYLNITLVKVQKTQFTALIYDASGNVIKEVRTRSKVTQIDMNGLSSGTYFVSLFDGTNNYTKQFVKK
ncbi:M20/M25/M40 family metallo-hydrolase [Aquimarina sp. W85]|uniref:M20/M25/M40 family metallo-hydrolase n=1 Tax=Aquimarina rhodophyticola TaxID=3342246 RepID=UPI00366FB870